MLGNNASDIMIHCSYRHIFGPEVKNKGGKTTRGNDTQSDNYMMRLRLWNKTGTKDLSTICILFKVYPFYSGLENRTLRPWGPVALTT
jgi:hypothetical protein